MSWLLKGLRLQPISDVLHSFPLLADCVLSSSSEKPVHPVFPVLLASQSGTHGCRGPDTTAEVLSDPQ